jgi:hypothetical protein
MDLQILARPINKMTTLIEKLERISYGVEMGYHYGPCTCLKLMKGKSLKTLKMQSHKIYLRTRKEHVYIGEELPATEYGHSYQEYSPQTGE